MKDNLPILVSIIIFGIVVVASLIIDSFKKPQSKFKLPWGFIIGVGFGLYAFHPFFQDDRIWVKIFIRYPGYLSGISYW